MADVVVAGGGPAGWALASACARIGLHVTLVTATTSWPATYGMWLDETSVLPAGSRWVSARARGGGRWLPREYAVLDNESVLAAFAHPGIEVIKARVETMTATEARLTNGEVLSGMVFDATGALGAADRIEQTAYGVVVSAEEAAEVVGPGEAVFMDWRSGDPATFLYAVPLPDGRVLLEETSLARKPGLGFGELRDRLHARLNDQLGDQLGDRLSDHHGKLLGDRLLGDRLLRDRLLGDRLLGDRLLGDRLLGDRLLGDRLLGDRLLGGAAQPAPPLDDGASPPVRPVRPRPVERVRFPVDIPPPPLRDRGAIPFGAAGGFVHPASGFSLADTFRLAPVVASSVRGGSAAVRRVLWPARVRVVYRLRRRGLATLLSLTAAEYEEFFDLFFALPDRHQRAYLSGRADLRGTAAAMAAMFRAAPTHLRRKMIKP